MTDLPPIPPEAPKSARSPLWMRITLAASLAVNLLVVGVIVGSLVTRDGRGDGMRSPGALRDLGPIPFVVALEPEDRRGLIRAMRGEAASLSQNREELRARFEAFLAALRADPFDASTVAGLLGEQRQIGAQRQAIGEKLLLERLSEMSTEERQAYADRLDKSLRRGSKR